ncbi:hypothetical protein BD324DRAFT_648113 [Kockovaella imperatae]|uniref:Glycosyltransferase 61 catalytic domain-containing protein n=1 Tax=Kockovaella imperatae TaxID=4999 RepID=A0A1Y1UT89_9TREE|nr:hypothetical protein BD324DRAFT_648113 [Kockovaella imperatae]ORX41230.1 hypothetical protein BD324DRAFT_648113 [Kockovaella imperatae]
MPMVVLLAIFSSMRYGVHDVITSPKSYILPSSFTTPAPPKSHNYISTRAADLPQTELVAGVAGFNYFRNLYYFGSTFYVVTDEVEEMKKIEYTYVITGLKKEDAEGKSVEIPVEETWQVISFEEAEELFKPVVVRKNGLTLFYADATSPNFLGHYFHLVAEMFLGAMRVQAADGEYELPARTIYRGTAASRRDRYALNEWFNEIAMPNTALEDQSVLQDRTHSGIPYVYERIVIADRWAAHKHGKNPRRWNKVTGDVPDVQVPADWFRPVRNSIKLAVLASGCDIRRKDPSVPVVLYVNRQDTGRRLLAEDAESLAFELDALHQQGLIELHDVQMGKVSKLEQFCLACKADVMLGVHGNGLTHQMWMKPGSAVLEMMTVGGHARDYNLLADMVGHQYETIHNNHTFPREKWGSVGQGKNFHSSSIRADGKFVAELVLQKAQERIKNIEPSL